ncbi:TorF family putative porin [Chenggangzhangella methanolivorans]|uniref:TorF family putative porin n=1 Tax=Chenggangzhangella methanolivorans TaxID=1437009 RepID=A0A9E6UGQ3_9HYPH|nr:TorF family putative porin [Chenggangzhangella methanolivorans]QZN98982.1 TorF family putative porin [Chenggangzhangella methanolivorans]
MSKLSLAVGAALLSASLGVSAASAADMPEVIDVTTAPLDVAFGVKGTSDYLVRGISQTKGDPAVQGYVEVQAFDWVYAGVWASSVNFGGAQDPSAEVDIYGGVRHTFDKLTLDAGYVWVDFLSEVKGSRTLAYGKVYGIASYALTENFSFGGNIYYGTDYINLGAEITHATGFAKYKFAPLDTMPELGAYLSGSFSRMWTSKNFAPDYNYWDAGVGLTYKAMTLDFRYSDSNLKKSECFTHIGSRGSCGDRYLVSLSFDTSLNKLK